MEKRLDPDDVLPVPPIDGLAIAKLNLQAGDTLVVRCPAVITWQQGQAIKAELERVLPEDVAIVLLPQGFDLSVVRKIS